MANVVCKFYVIDNKLVRISGADAGSYPILDNHANIKIATVAYQIQPYNPVYCKIDTKQQITTTVTT